MCSPAQWFFTWTSNLWKKSEFSFEFERFSKEGSCGLGHISVLVAKFFNYLKQKIFIQGKLRRILQPGIAIRLNFAASWIICEWTYDEFPRSIRFDLESNTYIMGEYDEYMLKRS